MLQGETTDPPWPPAPLIAALELLVELLTLPLELVDWAAVEEDVDEAPPLPLELAAVPICADGGWSFWLLQPNDQHIESDAAITTPLIMDPFARSIRETPSISAEQPSEGHGPRHCRTCSPTRALKRLRSAEFLWLLTREPHSGTIVISPQKSASIGDSSHARVRA
jgi:hypothetical protein